MAGKLEDRVREIIVDQLGVNAEQVTTEASFIDDLGADSLDSVELIMAFEEEFGAAIPEEDAEKLTKEKYDPCCCTPLFDAIGKTVKTLKKKIANVEDSAVLVTIITDGYENSSKEWDGKAVAKLIDECKEEGWMFSFISSGQHFLVCPFIGNP